MSIKLLKELEDLKQVKNQLSSQMNKHIDIRINQFAVNAFTDFERFFKEKGFKIQFDEKRIAASYGSLIANLSYDPSVQYFGIYLKFDLYLQFLDRTTHTIALNPTTIDMVSISYEYENQIQKEIAQTRDQIEKLTSKINNFSEEEWAFFLQDNNSKSPHSGEIFKSFYDLLDSLIK
ncbi:hypothetical protein [Anaerospora sp.]|uniref:hypothetical protein n=1 Tax=Anaerospora sp. TaxID=1960278 RepID=UPI00289FA0F0|nr:hypothetical protein [Anaerospora sp.]